ncbi:MAG TPA: helix-turn-helix domain-containing protein [Streptosporangiaceae bacterium]|nr:helix-turn-helix domain-containing protein [Streptosporangiaceae bacterium]
MLIVGTDDVAVEADLTGGRIGCPTCEVALRPWGHGVEREVRHLERTERRRLRRSICKPCATTHVLVPEDTLLRRRDGAEVIGAALAARAKGVGHRRIAEDLGRAPSTVRGWLRAFGARAVALREHFARWAHALDPGHDRRWAGGSEFSDAVEAIGVLGIVAVRRFGPRSVWSLASLLTGGRLLCNTSWPWAQPV